MSFVRVACFIALGATACSGAPHDLDLEDLQDTAIGQGAGTPTGTPTGSTSTGTTNPAGGGMVGGVTWNGDVSPAIAGTNCRQVGCHGNGSMQGSYSLESYGDALGSGTDGTPNVVPGDPNSRLLTKCQEGHELCALATLFNDWIVNNDAAQ